MISPGAFDHVAIKANNVPDTLTFYETVLDATVCSKGLLEHESWSDSFEFVGIETGGLDLYLLEKLPYEAEGAVDTQETGFVHFGFRVDDVAVSHEAMVSADAIVEMGPTEIGDLKMAFYRDPAGTRFELLEEQ